MAALHRTEGARAPLFDRLVDLEPEQKTEARPLRMLDRDGLRRSVIVEVERLLNTRCPFDRETVASRERTTLEYGLPDLSNYYAEDEEAQIALCSAIRDAVLAYEPRLSELQVTVVSVDRRHQRLVVELSGTIVSGSIVEPVSFPVDLVGLRDEGSR